jgi:hypothetical protein
MLVATTLLLVLRYGVDVDVDVNPGERVPDGSRRATDRG